jgi:TolA-binding protein
MTVRRLALSALIMAALFSACGRKSPAPAVVRPPPATPPQESPETKPDLTPVVPEETEKKPQPVQPSDPSAVEPPPTFLPSSFQVGEDKFQEGMFDDAALSYEEFLKENPDHEKCELARFKLGLCYAFSDSSLQFQGQARAAFESFISEYPKSPLRPQAEYILRLQADILKLKSDAKEKDKKIERLTEELARLKNIDLERRPSRPPR